MLSAMLDKIETLKLYTKLYIDTIKLTAQVYAHKGELNPKYIIMLAIGLMFVAYTVPMAINEIAAVTFATNVDSGVATLFKTFLPTAVVLGLVAYIIYQVIS